jgi:hypothetical protein
VGNWTVSRDGVYTSMHDASNICGSVGVEYKVTVIPWLFVYKDQ